MSLKGVIFDFDGVIANTEPLHLRAYQEVFAEAGLSLTSAEYYDQYLGYDDVGVLQALARDRGRTLSEGELRALVDVKSQRFDALLGSADTIFPGAADCARRLSAEVPLAIASGALLAEIETTLARAGLRGCFRAIVAAGHTARTKPAPDPYLRAVELLQAHVVDRAPRTEDLEPGTENLEPGTENPSLSCYVAVEDSRWGIESARAAGLRCVGVANTYAAGELGGADLLVPNLSALTLDVLRDLCDKGS